MNSGSMSEYLSRKTFQELEKELEYLATKKRQEISKRLAESSSLGDLTENAEYQETKVQQLMNERRIAELEDLLSRAVILSENNNSSAIRVRVEMGCVVVLKKEGREDVLTYQIVGSEEADPTQRKISNESPLGVSLLGKKKGEKMAILTPRGKTEYTVIEIT